MPRWTNLNSPGRATSERAAYELELLSVMRIALRTFLEAVHSDARAELSGGSEPFTLGQVLQHWEQVVQSMVDALVSRHGDPDYLRAVRSRLVQAPMPATVYASGRTALNTVKTEHLGRTEALALLIEAFAGDTGTMTLTAAAEPKGQSPETIAAMIARTEATAAFGFSQLTAIAEAGGTTKRWVTRHDKNVRRTHGAADGQTVPLTQPFAVGGYLLMVPGDPAGPLSETANCRCVPIGPDTNTARASGWAAEMSEADATSYAAESVVQRDVFHATTTQGAEAIRRTGFDVARTGEHGNAFGAGVYSTSMEDLAKGYAGSRDSAVVLRMKVMLKNPVSAFDPDYAKAELAQRWLGGATAVQRAGLPENILDATIAAGREVLEQLVPSDVVRRFKLPAGITNGEFLGLDDEAAKAVVRLAAQSEGSAGGWTIQAYLRQQGYDGVVVPSYEGHFHEVVAFSKEQVVVVRG